MLDSGSESKVLPTRVALDHNHARIATGNEVLVRQFATHCFFFRPSVMFDSVNRSSDDLTYKMVEIIKVNAALR